LSTRSYTFSHAIVRKPSTSIADGLRAVDIGTPCFDLFCQHHSDYVAALASTGANITILEALEEFPDSVFIEDAALCLPEGAVILRPGAPSRLGEAAELAPTLADLYDEVVRVEGPGFIEGGDILTTEREIVVGTSARTTLEGVEELRTLVSRWGLKVREVTTPDDVLHFKTDCSLLDEETILSTTRLSNTGCFDGYKILHTAEGEEACANAIRFNELVLMPAGFPKTADMLASAGYTVRTVGNTEAAKLDGGVSCMSLRLSPAGA
jgi:dimethylargininase